MPLLHILSSSPLRTWPALIGFFVQKLVWPKVWSRLKHGVPLEVRAMEHVIQTTKQGDAEAVLRALDAFGREEFLMNVGDEKGRFLISVIQEAKPKVVIELGAYLGYSAIEIARNMPSDGHLYSIELEPLNAALATKLVEWAGLQDKVTIIIGGSSTTIPTLRETYKIDKVDVVFLDHWKDLYLPDLKLLESHDYLQRGYTVIVADNVLIPGAPDYLAYVTEAERSAPTTPSEQNQPTPARTYYYKTELHETTLEYTPHIKDLVTISTPI